MDPAWAPRSCRSLQHARVQLISREIHTCTGVDVMACGEVLGEEQNNGALGVWWQTTTGKQCGVVANNNWQTMWCGGKQQLAKNWKRMTFWRVVVNSNWLRIGKE
jgi:hypothetical protein